MKRTPYLVPLLFCMVLLAGCGRECSCNCSDVESTAPAVTVVGAPQATDVTPHTTAEPIETAKRPTETTAAPAAPVEPPTFALYEPVNSHSTHIFLQLINPTAQMAVTSGTNPTIERLEDGEWVPLEKMPFYQVWPEANFVPDRPAWTYKYVGTPAGETRIYGIALLNEYGKLLSPGEYRIPVEYAMQDGVSFQLYNIEWQSDAWYFTVTE
ncbi:MAG: hypothetical protein IJX53_01000 [Clostridia bacterium]|nr:hypothetical protein [Clostridia bacterium]